MSHLVIVSHARIGLALVRGNAERGGGCSVWFEISHQEGAP